MKPVHFIQNHNPSMFPFRVCIDRPDRYAEKYQRLDAAGWRLFAQTDEIGSRVVFRAEKEPSFKVSKECENGEGVLFAVDTLLEAAYEIELTIEECRFCGVAFRKDEIREHSRGCQEARFRNGQ